MTGTAHIVLAMKPIEGNFVANAKKHGVAGLNIDGCRIAGIDPANAKRLGRNYKSSVTNYGDVLRMQKIPPVVGGSLDGRWPANVIHDGSDSIMDCFPMSGSNARLGKANGKTSIWGSGVASKTTSPDDSGSAARFFKRVKV